MPHKATDLCVAASPESRATCEFATCSEEMTRAQTVREMTSSKDPERLLMIKRLALENTGETTRRVESATHRAMSPYEAPAVSQPVEANAVRHKTAACKAPKSIDADSMGALRLEHPWKRTSGCSVPTGSPADQLLPLPPPGETRKPAAVPKFVSSVPLPSHTPHCYPCCRCGGPGDKADV